MAKKPHKEHPDKRTTRKRSTTKRPEERRQPFPDHYPALQSTGPVTRGEIRVMLVLCLVALALRLLSFFIARDSNPLYHHPILDSLFHHEWALRIVSGEFWGTEVFFRAPLYPYFLALIYKITGSNPLAAVVCQHFMGTASVVLVYLLAREFFSIRVAATAGLFAALYWPLIYFESELLIVTLVVLLDLLMLLMLAKALRQQRSRLFLVGGLIMGLSAIARPTVLIMIPVIPFLTWMGHREEPAGRARRGIRNAIVVLIGVAIVALPVVVRNYIVGRDIVPIASQGGVNFYIGNNPQSNGTQAVVPGATADLYGTYQGAIALAERDAGRRLKPSEVSNYYFRKGVNFWLSDPDAAVRLTLRKLYYFWGAVERSNNKYIQFFWNRYGLGKIPLPGFGLMGPLALTGGILLWPRRRALALPYLFTVAYMIGVIVFFVNARFRLPVMPILMIFAAYAIISLSVTFREARGRLLGPLAALAFCTAFVNADYLNFRGVRAMDEAVSYYELGNAFVKMDRKSEALDAFESAHDIQVRYPSRAYTQIAPVVDYYLGTIYWERGLYSRAIEALERLQTHPEAAASTRTLLADCYERTGRIHEALAGYEAAVAASPADKAAWLGLLRCYRRVGNAEGASTVTQRLQSLFPNDVDVRRAIEER